MRRRALGLFALALLLALFVRPGRAHADTAFTIRRSEARVDFPRGVTFQLESQE